MRERRGYVRGDDIRFLGEEILDFFVLFVTGTAKVLDEFYDLVHI